MLPFIMESQDLAILMAFVDGVKASPASTARLMRHVRESRASQELKSALGEVGGIVRSANGDEEKLKNGLGGVLETGKGEVYKTAIAVAREQLP